MGEAIVEIQVVWSIGAPQGQPCEVVDEHRDFPNRKCGHHYRRDWDAAPLCVDDFAADEAVLACGNRGCQANDDVLGLLDGRLNLRREILVRIDVALVSPRGDACLLERLLDSNGERRTCLLYT